MKIKAKKRLIRNTSKKKSPIVASLKDIFNEHSQIIKDKTDKFQKTNKEIILSNRAI